MKIFVLHYSKLVERKQNILQQFSTQNITNYEFIELFDKDVLTNEDKKLFIPDFKPSLMSLVLKHFYVYKEIAEKYHQALILEDDVILSNNFTTILNHYLCQLPNDYDMLFIGNGCNLHIDSKLIKPNQNIYLKDKQQVFGFGHQVNATTRCTDSYIVSNKCAKQLCNYIANLQYKINLPSDWWINLADTHNNFNIYWAEPTIVVQGSEIGLYKSSLR
jgi:GR25 family glycosyltransferase involved in LPS biosynthesis